jgi:hypothetical protein
LLQFLPGLSFTLVFGDGLPPSVVIFDFFHFVLVWSQFNSLAKSSALVPSTTHKRSLTIVLVDFCFSITSLVVLPNFSYFDNNADRKVSIVRGFTPKSFVSAITIVLDCAFFLAHAVKQRKETTLSICSVDFSVRLVSAWP